MATASLTDDEILRAVEAWVDDLARGDYRAAFTRTDHDPHYRWTPELIEAVINGYGLPEPHPSGTRFTVSSRDSARGQGRYEIDRIDLPHPRIAHVFYDLPLNGEWSDLTVTFRVEERDDSWTLILEEIHVF